MQRTVILFLWIHRFDKVLSKNNFVVCFNSLFQAFLKILIPSCISVPTKGKWDEIALQSSSSLFIRQYYFIFILPNFFYFFSKCFVYIFFKVIIRYVLVVSCEDLSAKIGKTFKNVPSANLFELVALTLLWLISSMYPSWVKNAK